MSTSGKVQLTATAPDAAAEVFVINSRLELVDRGIGSVTTFQPSGVYKLKVRAGLSTYEELVVLEDKPVTKTLGQLQISSAAPLDQTAQCDEYHQKAAKRESRKTSVKLGTGSSILLFARDWTPQGKPPASGDHPARGLTLRSTDGAELVDFQKKSHVGSGRNPWAACRIDLAPSAYLLALTAPSGESLEMVVIAHPGWQTQVFLLQREDKKWKRGRRPDLAGASVIMTRGNQFDYAAPDNRRAELARLALVDRRMVLSEEWNQRLQSDYTNPVLGIMGGHLILRTEKPGRKYLQAVIENLRNRILDGVPHPDVEALALAAGMAPRCDFGIPPMLRPSWEIVVKHSLKQAGLIPAKSLAARIATCVTNQVPWLVWRSRQNAEDDCTADIIDDFRDLLTVASKEAEPIAVQRLFAHQTRFAERSPKKAGEAAIRALHTFLRPGTKAGGQAAERLAKRLAPALGLPPSTVSHLIGDAMAKTPGIAASGSRFPKRNNP